MLGRIAIGVVLALLAALPATAQFGDHLHEFEGYLGNVGTIPLAVRRWYDVHEFE